MTESGASQAGAAAPGVERPLEIDPIERLITIRGEAWSVVVNGAWGDGHWLAFAERIYTMAAQVVGPSLADKNFETAGRGRP